MGAMTDTIGDRVLCDADCVAKLAAGDIQTTPSGLQYQDIIEGRGPVPEVGYQVRTARLQHQNPDSNRG